MLLSAYLLPVMRGKFLLGLMLPVAYFAARATEDFWFPRLNDRRWRYRLVAALVPLLAASNIVALFAPLLNVSRLTLPSDYGAAFGYLRSRPAGAVVASSGPVGLWLPVWTGKQVVYATSQLTLDAPEKAAAVRRFFAMQSAADCAALLNGEFSAAARYEVRYVVAGPLERAFGDSVCLDGLVEMARFGTVTVYRTVR
jgi:hypothetical protein